MGITSGAMLAIALKDGPHQQFDNAWNNWVRVMGAVGQRYNQGIFTTAILLEQAAIIYAEHPEILLAIRRWVEALQESGLL